MDNAAVISAHTSEYSALRGEILSFIAIEHQVLNFNIALLAALIAFFTKISDSWQNYKWMESVLLLIFPLPFLVLGFFFGYAQIRVIQVAAYLQQRLRPDLVAILGRDDVWRWEFFRRNEIISHCPLTGLANFLGFLRWGLFLWPFFFLVRVLWVPVTFGRIFTRPTLRSLALIEVFAFLFLFVFAAFCSKWLPRRVL